MSDKIWDLNEEQRKIALGAFRKFLKECIQSGFTVRQIEVIGIHARNEVMRMITVNNLITTIGEDLFHLLEENDALQKECGDKPMEACTVSINEVPNDITNRVYQEPQPRHHKEADKDIFKVLNMIDEAILEKYAEFEQQGSVLTGIENLYRQVSFDNPELAAHIKKRMLQIAKENGVLFKG